MTLRVHSVTGTTPTRLRVHSVLGAGSEPAAGPKRLRVHSVSGFGASANAKRLRVHSIAGSGTTQAVLTSPKATYDPGELVTVQAGNRGSIDTFRVSGTGLVVGSSGLPADAAVVDGLLTFTAPATLDGTSLTIAYNGTAFLTVAVTPAFALVNGKPALVAVSLPAAAVAVATPVTPLGPAGVYSAELLEDFDGTALKAPWINMDGASMNGVTARAANVKVANSILSLQLSSATEGAYVASNLNSTPGQGPLWKVGDVLEFRVYVPGDANGAFNWSAGWASGPPVAEFDLVEVLARKMTSNYHWGTSYTTDHKQKNGDQPDGTFSGRWLTVTAERRSKWIDLYYDGRLVRSYATSDPGLGMSILMNAGTDGNPVLGAAGAIQFDWVRLFNRVGAEPVFSTISDAFAGGAASGAPIGWTAQNSKGSIAVDSAGRLALTTAAGAYAGGPGLVWTRGEPVADCELLAEATLTSLTEQYHKLGVRCDHQRTGDDLPYNGYLVELRPSQGEWQLTKVVDGTKTVLATVGSYTYSTTVATKVRLRTIGTTIQARVWQVGSAEPTSWGATFTDSGVPLGRAWVTAQNGNDGAARTVALDNVSLTGA